MSIKVISTAFREGGMIPKRYTHDGSDYSPPIAWSGIPEGTKSLALVSEDPDAPMGTWTHWVVYNIPPDTKELSEHVPNNRVLPKGVNQGISDFGRFGYGGPAPPSGTHRYYFHLYALDKEIEAKEKMTKNQLLNLIKGHILDEGQIMGKYKR